jgi:hypothetical protein
MKVTRTTWLVYGTFNGDPLAQFFDDGKEAWQFVQDLSTYPNNVQRCLAVNEVQGVDYEAIRFIHHNEGVTKGVQFLGGGVTE